MSSLRGAGRRSWSPSIRVSSLSAAGAAASMILWPAGLAAAPLGLAEAHMALLALTASLTFPYSLYLAFLAGLAGPGPRRGFKALAAAATLLFSASTPLAALADWRLARALSALASASLAAYAAAEARGQGKGPSWALPLPPLAGLAAAAAAVSPLEWVALQGALSASSMIHVVGLFTMARVYGSRPSSIRLAAPLALDAAAVASALAGAPLAALALSASAGLAYLAALGVQRGIRLVSAGGLKGRVVRAAVAAHLSSAAGLAVALAYSAAGDIVAAAHGVYMGFIGVNILLHAPLMLPHVLKVKARWLPSAPAAILMALASAVRPLSGDASLALVVLSAAAALASVKGGPRGG